MPTSLRKIILYPFFLALLTGLVLGLYLLYKDTDPPVLTLSPEEGPVSLHTRFTLKAADPGSGLKSIHIKVTADRFHKDLPELIYPSKPGRITEEFTLTDLGLKDGPFKIEIMATDGSYAHLGEANQAVFTQSYQLDSTPPKILVKGNAPAIAQGGSACVKYTLSETAALSGLVLNKLFFPGYRQPNGEYICFFAFPCDMETEDYKLFVVARDMVGNQSHQPLPVNVLSKSFKSDTISLSPSFVEGKARQFADETPGDMSPLDCFLFVNRELRIKSDGILINLGRKSTDKILWQGSFLRMPHTATTATFGDRRTYVLEGKAVDQQIHKGMDLASTKEADVPAANYGRVIFADYLNIYGKMILIDHGLGLMSLYSHLSKFHVGAGDWVEKGKIIAQTGATGMAGGDHLHFGILISGIPVSPVEWWDAQWISSHIDGRLK